MEHICSSCSININGSDLLSKVNFWKKNLADQVNVSINSLVDQIEIDASLWHKDKTILKIILTLWCLTHSLINTTWFFFTETDKNIHTGLGKAQDVFQDDDNLD